MRLAKYRKRPALLEGDLASDPIEQFRRWHEEARQAGGPMPEAMALATVSPDGRPAARMVLLRGVDSLGFVFFTNYTSRKARDLECHPQAALVFHWPELGRQVRVEGAASRVSAAESDAYFDSRPVGSRLGAIVSPQSQVVPGREPLDQAVRALASELRRARCLPARPGHWGGYRVRPDHIEFWQVGRNRLHDRLRYRREASGAWALERLAP